MTDEQIRKNAEAYAKSDEATIMQRAIRRTAYIAGAHSRDEEIEELKEEIESLQEQYKTCFDGFRKRGKKLGELMKENVKLRNPLISVEDRLPKKTRGLELLDDEHDKVVIVCRRFGEAVTAYLDAEEIWRLYPTGRPFYGEITHWMPIPELPKGGEK